MTRNFNSFDEPWHCLGTRHDSCFKFTFFGHIPDRDNWRNLKSAATRWISDVRDAIVRDGDRMRLAAKSTKRQLENMASISETRLKYRSLDFMSKIYFISTSVL